jgi:hypothetical protein
MTIFSTAGDRWELLSRRLTRAKAIVLGHNVLSKRFVWTGIGDGSILPRRFRQPPFVACYFGHLA